ncbi:hypothetical protein F2P81_009442 [Scophthalmus maximus]|uniref:Uncharacterized protein n=1 Tax=Scophthalmus maximus TaxID=52904 RepID=A0A6A4T3P6_SCOMX|nr:hypothetical protein F2P81_009442 [Scophthalmus maximus]
MMGKVSLTMNQVLLSLGGFKLSLCCGLKEEEEEGKGTRCKRQCQQSYRSYEIQSLKAAVNILTLGGAVFGNTGLKCEFHPGVNVSVWQRKCTVKDTKLNEMTDLWQLVEAANVREAGLWGADGGVLGRLSFSVRYLQAA